MFCLELLLIDRGVPTITLFNKTCEGVRGDKQKLFLRELPRSSRGRRPRGVVCIGRMIAEYFMKMHLPLG